MLKILPVIAIVSFFLLLDAKSCNEAVCRGIVSKCLLLESCMCLAHNTTCYKTCFDCLGTYTNECCPCFVKYFPDFCVVPDDDESIDGELERQSVVEDFVDTIPGLFRALTEYSDENSRWESVTFPIHINMNNKHDEIDNKVVFNMHEKPNFTPPLGQDIKNIVTFNCTVAFLHDCTSRIKCRKNCLTMGANSYRWFHNGCCECVGEKCIYYGIDQSKCLDCPPRIDEDEQDDEEDEELDEGDYYDYY